MQGWKLLPLRCCHCVDTDRYETSRPGEKREKYLKERNIWLIFELHVWRVFGLPSRDIKISLRAWYDICKIRAIELSFSMSNMYYISASHRSGLVIPASTVFSKRVFLWYQGSTALSMLRCRSACAAYGCVCGHAICVWVWVSHTLGTCVCVSPGWFEFFSSPATVVWGLIRSSTID